ncbi:hypothetical protein ACOMHN_057937 [Nucella lapillus]
MATPVSDSSLSTPQCYNGGSLEDSVSHTLIAVEVRNGRRPPKFIDSVDSSDSNTERSLLSEVKVPNYYTAMSPLEPKDHTICRICILHLKDCPAIEGLPVFLITEGVALALRIAVLAWQWKMSGGCYLCGGTEGGRARMLGMVGHCLELTFFILGVRESMKVYNVFPGLVTDDAGSPCYCNALLYRYAFSLLCGMYGAALLGLLATIATTCHCCRCLTCHRLLLR